jgi:hypothetical protein
MNPKGRGSGRCFPSREPNFFDNVGVSIASAQQRTNTSSMRRPPNTSLTSTCRCRRRLIIRPLWRTYVQDGTVSCGSTKPRHCSLLPQVLVTWDKTSTATRPISTQRSCGIITRSRKLTKLGHSRHLWPPMCPEFYGQKYYCQTPKSISEKEMLRNTGFWATYWMLSIWNHTLHDCSILTNRHNYAF